MILFHQSSGTREPGTKLGVRQSISRRLLNQLASQTPLQVNFDKEVKQHWKGCGCGSVNKDMANQITRLQPHPSRFTMSNKCTSTTIKLFFAFISHLSPSIFSLESNHSNP